MPIDAADSEASPEVIVRPSLHHVNLKTTRLDEMIDWYRLVVGAEVNFRNDGAAWLSNDGANHRLALLSLPGLHDAPGREQHTGLHHTAFEYASFDELMATFARLKTRGIEPGFCLDHGLTTSLYYFDPDGNGVELQVDNFDDWARSTDYMRHSADFRENPIGVFFDPSQVLAAHRAGEPLSQLRQRVRAGAFVPDPLPQLR